ncbi:hypothetical protein KW797_02005 [Candidatus Parcubacteria bacterium]|nr:hypothetical protein [Candidatus Parcubacteria bacterium]
MTNRLRNSMFAAFAVIAGLFGSAAPSFAAEIFHPPWTLEQNASGFALSGGKLYFYEPGATTTPKAVYQDSALGVQHANPVVADAAGRFAPIYMSGQYAVVLKDSAGSTIKTTLTVGVPLTSAGGTTSLATNTSIDSTYDGDVIRATNTITLSLLAIASAGEGFSFYVINDGTGLVTIDPNSSEQVNDTTTWAIPPGGAAYVRASTSEWSALGSMGIVQSLASGDIFYANSNKQLTRLARGSDGQFLKLASSLPSWASFALTDLAPQAADTINANITAGSASPTAVAISANQFLARASTGRLEQKSITDFGLSLVDDANASAALSTLGIVPSGATLIASGSLSGATVDINSIPQTYAYLVLVIRDASSGTATRGIQVRFDDASTYAAALDARWLQCDTTTWSRNSSTGVGRVWTEVTQAAAEETNIILKIGPYQAGTGVRYEGKLSAATGPTHTDFFGALEYAASVSAAGVLSMQIGWDDTGNFDAGTYALYGVN